MTAQRLALLVALGAFVLPLLLAPVLRRRGGLRRWLGAVLLLVLLGAGLLVPAAEPLLGFAASFACAWQFLKTWDVVSSEEDWPLSELVWFILHPGALTSETFRRSRRAPLRRVWRRGVLGAGLLAGGLGLVAWSLQAGIFAHSFALDHLLKGVAFGLIAEGAASSQHALFKLLGWGTVPVIDGAFLARTPAEFWQRYNRWVCIWLDKHVFKPAGGRSRMLRATLWTFLVSGLIHEWLFALAIHRIDGYQLPFFLIQGLGVVASLPLQRVVRRRAWAGWLGRVLTWAFLYGSSILFFASGARVLPALFTAPRWLP